jgi:hypothetical protein
MTTLAAEIGLGRRTRVSVRVPKARVTRDDPEVFLSGFTFERLASSEGQKAEPLPEIMENFLIHGTGYLTFKRGQATTRKEVKPMKLLLTTAVSSDRLKVVMLGVKMKVFDQIVRCRLEGLWQAAWNDATYAAPFRGALYPILVKGVQAEETDNERGMTIAPAADVDEPAAAAAPAAEGLQPAGMSLRARTLAVQIALRPASTAAAAYLATVAATGSLHALSGADQPAAAEPALEVEDEAAAGGMKRTAGSDAAEGDASVAAAADSKRLRVDDPAAGDDDDAVETNTLAAAAAAGGEVKSAAGKRSHGASSSSDSSRGSDTSEGTDAAAASGQAPVKKLCMSSAEGESNDQVPVASALARILLQAQCSNVIVICQFKQCTACLLV